ncbi:MAG: MmgE/PrpD family protein, partial [Alphaproteobacteria bacterium]|nr:MmgE/PrpD family protein [Alphaproteobacteria bacterium]
EFAMASALTVRQAGLAQLTDEFVRRPDIQSLLPRVSLALNEAPSADDPAFASYDRVRVRRTDGSEIASPEIKFARGHWAMPLKDGELWAKFRDCAAGALAGNEAARLFEAAQAIDAVADIRTLRREGRIGAA